MNWRKINWIIIQNLNKIFRTTIFDEIYWKFRNCKGDWEGDKTYFDSWDHPHRKLIINTLKEKYGDKSFSLLEVGCNSGPNLELIKKNFPNSLLYGVDINKKSVEEGNKNNEKIKFAIGRVDSIPAQRKLATTVLADAVLMYVGPRKIKKAIEEMIRTAIDMIIIVDFHQDGFPSDGKIELGHWVRDYVKLFREFGLDAKVRKMTKEEWPSYSWEKLGYYITVNLN